MIEVDWKKEAINDLRTYKARRDSILTMSEKVMELEAKAERLGSAAATTPVQGGSSKSEDMLINCIVECDRLKVNIRMIKGLIASIERGLNHLTEEERRVLEGFYMNRSSRHIDKLCDELHFEKSRIYEIKDRALHMFTIAMYGFIET